MGENLPAARVHHATGDIRHCKASKDRRNATRSDFVAVDQAVIFVELPDPAPDRLLQRGFCASWTERFQKLTFDEFHSIV
jgi:hypothetical protein